MPHRLSPFVGVWWISMLFVGISRSNDLDVQRVILTSWFHISTGFPETNDLGFGHCCRGWLGARAGADETCATSTTQQATRVARADFQSNSVPNLVVASCHLNSFDVNFLDPSEFYTHPPFAALEALDVSDICCLFTSSMLSRLCLRFSTKAAAKKAAANMFRSLQILRVLPWLSILHIAYRYDILICC